MNRQYGFRRGFSTETAVISLVDQIRNQTGQKRHTAAIFIDLRKAFDTVDHSLLLRKLNVIGFTQQAKNWFRSYLENRNQYVELQGKSSSKEQVSCGVPSARSNVKFNYNGDFKGWCFARGLGFSAAVA